MIKSILLLGALAVIWPQTAHAYFDPGTGTRQRAQSAIERNLNGRFQIIDDQRIGNSQTQAVERNIFWHQWGLIGENCIGQGAAGNGRRQRPH